MTTAKKQNAALVLRREKAITPAKQFIIVKTAIASGLEQLAELMSRPDLPLPALAELHTAIETEWKKPLEEMRKMTRQGLIDAVEATTGTEITLAGGWNVKLESRRASSPDEKSVREYLQKKKFDEGAMARLFKQVISYELDVKALRNLIGDDAFDTLRPELSSALKVSRK